MKRLILILTLAFSTSSLFSQVGSFGKNDPGAKELLKQVTDKFKSYKTVFANFTLQALNTAGKEIGAENGSLQMKGDKYRILTASQQIFSDGKTIWTYDIADREIQITTYDPKSDMLTPQRMFTDFYDSTFLYKLNDEFKQGGKTIQQIELTPLDKSKPFFKMLINIDKVTKNLVSSTVFEKNGNRYLYSISSLETNTNLSDSLFIFDISSHKNVEVVDLR